jgi:hypothetical protein
VKEAAQGVGVAVEGTTVGVDGTAVSVGDSVVAVAVGVPVGTGVQVDVGGTVVGV